MQHDYIIDDADGATFLADLNDMAEAIATDNSGATAPTVTYAYMEWADTSLGKLKKRNGANTNWVIIGDLDAVGYGLLSKAGGSMAGLFQLDAGADIASGATVDLGAATGNDITITHSSGTTAITSFGGATAVQKGTRIRCRVSISGGTLTITYNATSMKIPRLANLTLVDGMSFDAVKISDSNAYWAIENVTKPDGTALVTSDIGKIQDVDASVAGNAMTITINPTTLQFRSTTLTDGTPETVNLTSAVSVVVPNTATLGMVNGVGTRLAVLAINNAGTIEAAVVNLAGGNNLDETDLISTTAISTAADSNNVIYSTTARSNVAYRVVGFIAISQATAGVWATAPSLVQGAGGNAITALSSIGYGQTWQDVKASRLLGTTYYNTTGKPIQVTFCNGGASGAQATVTVGGVIIGYVSSGGSAGKTSLSFIVPHGVSYVIANQAGSTFIETWAELR